ncbi:hypothetical protein Tco_1247769 [Tanacetum coccineum]
MTTSPSSYRRHAYDTTGLPMKLVVNNIPTGLHNYSNHVGEGSWNVAWDVRPARWILRPHNVWFLFGDDDPLVEFKNQTSCSKVVKDHHENVDGVRINGI